VPTVLQSTQFSCQHSQIKCYGLRSLPDSLRAAWEGGYGIHLQVYNTTRKLQFPAPTIWLQCLL